MRARRLACVIAFVTAAGLSAWGQTTSVSPPSSASKDAKDSKKFEWPKLIAGKDVQAYMKELTDSDPDIRNLALQTIPKFGPSAQPVASRALVKALEREMSLRPPAGSDPAVVVAAVSAIAELGLANDTDIKDACRSFAILITTSQNRSVYRQFVIPAYASMGRKAENGITTLTQADVMQDQSYETRRMVVGALYYVGQDDLRGPSTRALDVITKMSLSDVSAVVRLEAFHTLVLFGPPTMPRTAGDTKPALINKQAAAVYMPAIKAQLSKEKDPQVEAWARVAVMRFDPEKEVNAKNVGDLAAMLGKATSTTKIQVLAALGMLGQLAEKQIPAILAELRDPEPLVVDAAVKTLVAMGDKAKSVLPEIKAQLEARKEEYFKELLKAATKAIEESKPLAPVEAPLDPKMTTTPKK